MATSTNSSNTLKMPGVDSSTLPYQNPDGLPQGYSGGSSAAAPQAPGAANTITGGADPYNMAQLTQQNQNAQVQPSGTPNDGGTPGQYTLPGANGSMAGGVMVQGGAMPGNAPGSLGMGVQQNFQPTNYSQAGSSSYGGGGANPYIAQQAAALTAAHNKNLTDVLIPGVNQNAVTAGGFGGARHGLAQGNAIAGAQGGLDSALAGLYSGAYESDANRSLQGSIANGQLGVATQGLQNSRDANMMNFYTQQRGLDYTGLGLGANLYGQGNLAALNQGSGVYGLGAQEQQAPWQNLQNYNGILQPGYQLNGQQTTSGAGPSSGQSALGGAAAGAALGSQILPGWGTAIGAGLGGIYGYTQSDRNSKENIKRIGKTNSGLGVFLYNYKGDDRTHMGVMAQEVEKKQPEAVGLLPNGYKAVAYGLLQ